MEWIILSGSILVAAYFIYTAIQRRNDLNEKQLEQGLNENNRRLRSNIVDALEWDIIRAKANLEDAQKSGKEKEVEKANDVLQYRKAVYANALAQSVTTHLKSKKYDEK